MSQDEIKAALAEQEEHVKRSTSCQGVIGKSHAFRPHGTPVSREQYAAGRRRRLYSACVVCGVTETPRDYEAKQQQ